MYYIWFKRIRRLNSKIYNLQGGNTTELMVWIHSKGRKKNDMSAQSSQVFLLTHRMSAAQYYGNILFMVTVE